MRYLTMVAITLLTGCAAPAPQPSASVCPSVINYTPAQEAEIFAALTALPSDSILHTLAEEDYHLRTELKACRN